MKVIEPYSRHRPLETARQKRTDKIGNVGITGVTARGCNDI